MIMLSDWLCHLRAIAAALWLVKAGFGVSVSKRTVIVDSEPVEETEWGICSKEGDYIYFSGYTTDSDGNAMATDDFSDAQLVAFALENGWDTRGAY